MGFSSLHAQISIEFFGYIKNAISNKGTCLRLSLERITKENRLLFLRYTPWLVFNFFPMFKILAQTQATYHLKYLFKIIIDF